jgi:glycine hydroxymethyltransferase
VRILDLAGIVANKNTIPGDSLTSLGMGIRLGTPWLTQRGFGPGEMDQVAGLIHRVVTAIHPFAYTGLAGELPRGKIDLWSLEAVKKEVADLAVRGAADTQAGGAGYPHFFGATDSPGGAVIVVSGERAVPGLNQLMTADLAAMSPGDLLTTFILEPDGRVMDEVLVRRLEADEFGRDRFALRPHRDAHARVLAWLRGLGDGYVLFDPVDLFAKIEGPLVVEEASDLALPAGSGRSVDAGATAVDAYRSAPGGFEPGKPYFVGQHALPRSAIEAIGEAKPDFDWAEPEGGLHRTPLYDWHRAHSKHIVPFAGWEMPVWYTGVLDEHRAVRRAAALFDVAHMGVFEASGPHAEEFLDLVCTNYARWYAPGESFYSYLLDADGRVIDDLLIYRRAADRFLIVVNASNAAKDWAWLNAANRGEVLLDRDRPGLRPLRSAVLRNLKDPAAGADARVDLALQGPASTRILQSLAGDGQLRDRLGRLRKTGVMPCSLAGFDLVIARTGYTGEEVGYEIFVHPDRAVSFWEALLASGQPWGVQPAGLAARDSTRTEAGLPLYGHELAGPYGISPAGARFAAYVKLHKPFFVGRKPYLDAERGRTMEVARFRINEKGVRMPKTGDPVVSRRGSAIGYVTSAAVDVDGRILGLAYIQSRHAKPGEEIGVFNLPARPMVERDDKAALKPGDKVALADWATLLARFPGPAERAHWRGDELAATAAGSHPDSE